MSATVQNFDSNLGNILQNVRKIDSFLDVIFEFLYRRTDFYRLMRDDKDTMGLPPGMARRVVMQAFMKYEQMSLQNKATLGIDLEQDSAPAVAQEIQVTSEEKVTGQELSKSSACRVEDDLKKEINKQGKVEKLVSNVDNTKSTLTPADTYNGRLQDSHAWCQTLKDVDVKVFVPDTVKKAKQLTVEIKPDHVKVILKDPEQVLIDGKLTNRINCEESIWSLDPGKYVQINLEKKVNTWWKCVLEGDPEIDQQSIDNTEHLHEMDDEAQSDYRRAMHDFEQKRQGKPTSKELETQEILRKAWDVEGSPFKGTDFDPSTLNISAS